AKADLTGRSGADGPRVARTLAKATSVLASEKCEQLEQEVCRTVACCENAVKPMLGLEFPSFRCSGSFASGGWLSSSRLRSSSSPASTSSQAKPAPENRSLSRQWVCS